MKIFFVFLLFFSVQAWSTPQKGTCLDVVERAETNSTFSKIFVEQFEAGLWAYERALVCRNMNNKLKETFECMGQIKKELKDYGPFKNLKNDYYDAPYAILCSGVSDWQKALDCVKTVRKDNRRLTSEGLATVCSMGNSGQHANECLSETRNLFNKSPDEKIVELCAGTNQTLSQRKSCVQSPVVKCDNKTVNVSNLPNLLKAIACSYGEKAVCCSQELWSDRGDFKGEDGQYTPRFNVGYACGRGETAPTVRNCLKQTPLTSMLDKDDDLTSGPKSKRNRLSNIALNGVIQVCGGFPYTAGPAEGTQPASR